MKNISLFILLTVALIRCNTSKPVSQPVTQPGQTVTVRRVMVADKYHGFRSVKVNYIVNADDSFYMVNGHRMKLVGYDKTNKKRFKPTAK